MIKKVYYYVCPNYVYICKDIHKNVLEIVLTEEKYWQSRFSHSRPSRLKQSMRKSRLLLTFSVAIFSS